MLYKTNKRSVHTTAAAAAAAYSVSGFGVEDVVLLAFRRIHSHYNTYTSTTRMCAYYIVVRLILYFIIITIVGRGAQVGRETVRKNG